MRTNSSTVVWNSGSNIWQRSIASGPGATPTAVASNGFTCGNSGVPFAIDEANVYYLSGSVCSSGGLVSLTLKNQPLS